MFSEQRNAETAKRPAHLAGSAHGPKDQSSDCLELHCPFPSGINPHVHEVQESSLKWCLDQRIVAEGWQFEHLAKSKIGWLEARAFHTAPADRLQICSDWTHLFCLLDDRTDKLDCTEALERFLDGLLDVFTSGVLINDYVTEPFAHAFLNLRARMLDAGGRPWVEGFAEHLRVIFVGYRWETKNVANDVRPELGVYLKLRESTIGLYPQFHLAALTNDVLLPESVSEHPTLRRLMTACSNCVGWANDLCTYEKEIAAGEIHNLVSVLVDNEGLTVEAAARRAVAMHDAEIDAFVAAEAELPHFGEWDEKVREFVYILQSWIRGHLDWAQETGRYRPRHNFEDAPTQRAAQSSTWVRASSFENAAAI